ncbi:hypothetical protein CPB86DRAFT_823596 [Serendipita vermifera]|nr:hypothetical protein CPB86DRAFT_823596 [Serendipita vermifera]
MACWDELCLICGLRPEGGPRILFEDLDASLKMIIRSLEEQDIELKPSREQIVTIRLVHGWTGYGGGFTGIDGSDKAVYTNASAGGVAFFCLRGPYSYLQSWIDRDSLPHQQTAFPLEPEMNFEGEFYEIVNRRGKRRNSVGTLDIINYEGIDCALDQFQDFFSGAFFGAYELGSALKGGLRGNDLIPALLRDFCVWQTCPPDRWLSINTPSHHCIADQPPKSVKSIGHWRNVPAEIVIAIFSDLSIKEVLSFTSSCSYFHHEFGSTHFLSMLLRTQLRLPLSGSYWFLPVDRVQGEVKKFGEACHKSKHTGANPPLPKLWEVSVVFDLDFPLLQFFRDNYTSDSMKNRRRLWRISQQFRAEWYRYRTEGYKKPVDVGTYHDTET